MKLRENIAGSLVLAILTILVLLPLVTVLIQVVCPGLTLSELDLGNLSLVLDVFVRPLWKKAFINSAAMSLCTTAVGLLLAGVVLLFHFLGQGLLLLLDPEQAHS